MVHRSTMSMSALLEIFASALEDPKGVRRFMPAAPGGDWPPVPAHRHVRT